MEASITESAILVNINQSFVPGMTADQIYEATRKSWVIAPSKRDPQPRYAMAVFRGTIQQVFEIDEWHPSQEIPGRLYFTGRIASEKAHYIGQSVRHIKPGASNPIKYLNC